MNVIEFKDKIQSRINENVDFECYRTNETTVYYKFKKKDKHGFHVSIEKFILETELKKEFRKISYVLRKLKT